MRIRRARDKILRPSAAAFDFTHRFRRLLSWQTKGEMEKLETDEGRWMHDI